MSHKCTGSTGNTGCTGNTGNTGCTGNDDYDVISSEIEKYFKINYTKYAWSSRPNLQNWFHHQKKTPKKYIGVICRLIQTQYRYWRGILNRRFYNWGLIIKSYIILTHSCIFGIYNDYWYNVWNNSLEHKKTLGQFFTTNQHYILSGMKIPDNVLNPKIFGSRQHFLYMLCESSCSRR